MKKILIILLSLFIVSCHETVDQKQKANKFDTDKGDFDMGRFPLIKPWEATAPGHSGCIVSSIDTNSVPVTIPGTKQVRVVDSVIYVHAVNTDLNYQQVKEGWFIIIPKKHLFKGFKTHWEYLACMNSLKLKKEPELYNAGKVWLF